MKPDPNQLAALVASLTTEQRELYKTKEEAPGTFFHPGVIETDTGWKIDTSDNPGPAWERDDLRDGNWFSMGPSWTTESWEAVVAYLDHMLTLPIEPMIQQGGGFSPDVGSFFRKGDILYFDDGRVVELKRGRGYIIRYMPSPGTEDYSAWSEEKRAAVRAEHEADRKKYQEEAARHQAKIEALVPVALAKLTEEEIDALREHFAD